MNAHRLARLFASVLPVLAGATFAVACDLTTNAGQCPSFDVTFDQGLPPDTTAGDGGGGDGGDGGDSGLSLAQCQRACQESAACAVTQAGPPLTVHCVPYCLGREPAGLDVNAQKVGTIGAYFAEMARIEAASVHAFRIMARDLVRFQAPKRLVSAALRAADDERRHAKVARGLAKRHGEGARRLRIHEVAERSLFEIALENEVEGCARETFGALVGMYQARFAEDADVRAAMRRIARDEARHASLSHQVSRWVRTRLLPEQCAALDRARAKSLEGLLPDDGQSAPPFRAALGLPTKEVATELLRALQLAA